MNKEEEAALVDSYFLPGGILDPDEEQQQDDSKERSAHVPFSFPQSGVPLQNPWASVSRQWSELAQPPSMVGKQLAHPAVGENDADGRIERSFSDLARIFGGPLHESDTLMMFISSNYRAMPQNPELLHPERNVQIHSTEQSYERSRVDGMPLRPPPGFDQSIPTEVGVRAICGQKYHEEDSMRSDSSVPHELFQRDSDQDSFASSLSDSSIDELSLSNGSLHQEESTENQSENDVIQNDDIHNRWKGDVEGNDENAKDGYTEADENVGTYLDKAPTESPAAKKTKEDLREIGGKVMMHGIPPVSVESTMGTIQIDIPTPTKQRKRQRDKVNPMETFASQSKLSVYTRQSLYQRCRRSSLEWIAATVQGLLRYPLTSLQTGAGAIVTFYRLTIPLWMRFIRMLRIVLFTILRLVGILTSLSVLVCQSAIVEAFHETRVSLCYAALYFTPSFLSALMSYFVLPHFTPHLLSCAVLYGLCHTIKTENETTQKLQGVENARKGDNELTLSDKDKAGIASSKLETSARQACQTILRQARFNLPIMFFLEGFSHEMGAIMSLSGSGRLISAYILTIIRKDLLFSPIAWLSSALQLLIASYLHWVPWIDLFILVFGLASVRFSQFLNNRISTLKAKGC